MWFYIAQIFVHFLHLLLNSLFWGGSTSPLNSPPKGVVFSFNIPRGYVGNTLVFDHISLVYVKKPQWGIIYQSWQSFTDFRYCS